ncbi:hypothetical protein DXG01_010785 [Tephrocybe rancida]|nr:hypothetical protein DXG01_010785 [Tephrocybe rancida]
MPGTISSIPQACKGNNQGKLQAAQQKAGAAIQKLCESGEDSEAAAVLFARFEELKKRHDRLREFQESLPSITETPTEDAPTDNKDEAEPETSVPEQLQVVRHGDGAYECILSPDLKYPLPDDLNVEDSTQLAIGVARQFIHLAMQALAGCFDDLHDAQAIYLANIYDE